MDPQEEQQQELEVLESIYPDELEVLAPNRFNIDIRLDTPSAKTHGIVLGVTYPAQYPNEVPQLTLEAHEDEQSEDVDSDEDEDARRTRENINLAESISFERPDLALLVGKLEQEAELQLGIPSVFAIATQLKDEAEELFARKLQTLEAHREEEFKKLEAEQSKKFLGTKVTPESFAQWRSKFRQELGIDEKLQKFYSQQHQGKLTGKEIFEQGLANEEDEDLIEAVSHIKV